MRTYYNSRVLEWFELGRTELLRSLGRPYTEMEEAGLLLPVREARVEYLGTARYDDLLRMTTRMSMPGKARLRFEVEICHDAGDRPVCRGWTEHVVTNTAGKPVRPPDWLQQLAAP